MSCVSENDDTEPFFANLTNAPLRDLNIAMGYPLFAVTKSRRREPLIFRSDTKFVHVDAPATYGIPTILDADFLIAIASQLNEARELREKGRDAPKPSCRIRFYPYDILPMIGRSTGGSQYRWLAEALRRLRFVAVRTNLREEMRPEYGCEESFSWIRYYRIPTEYGGVMTPESDGSKPDGSRPWEIELDPIVFSEMTDPKNLLAIDPRYFELGPMERFLYRTARKHAEPGQKREVKPFTISMQRLYERSQAQESSKSFAMRTRKVAIRDLLPQYALEIFRNAHKEEFVRMRRDWSKSGRPRRGSDANRTQTVSRPVEKMWITRL